MARNHAITWLDFRGRQVEAVDGILSVGTGALLTAAGAGMTGVRFVADGVKEVRLLAHFTMEPDAARALAVELLEAAARADELRCKHESS
jgi:hypothetical protein